MLGAELGNFDAVCASVHHVLRDTFYFIAQYDGISLSCFRVELVEWDAALDLFGGKYLVTLVEQVADDGESIGVVAPLNGIFGTQCRLMDFS